MEEGHDGEDSVAVVGRDDLELFELVALGYDIVVGQHHRLGQTCRAGGEVEVA